MSVLYLWWGELRNEVLTQLHAEAFNDRVFPDDWWAPVNQHSLGWVCVNAGEDLVGFVNVVSDGAVHAFLLDTMVSKDFRGVDIGTDMVEIAVPETRATGCEWLHVDLEDHFEDSYFGRCGFKLANAGLIAFQ